MDDVAGIEALHGPAGLAEVVRSAGQRIRATLREDDFSAQWGGEELVVLLRDVSIDDTVEVGQRIRMAISQPLRILDGRTVVATCSIGAAGGEVAEPDALVGRARLALELAKVSGGNCVRRALRPEDRWTPGVAAVG